MTIPLALAGVFLGAIIFAATLNAGWRAYSAAGGLAWTQGIACGATIGAMIAVYFGLPVGVARAFGLLLTLVSMGNVIMEKGWHRALPIAHFAVGMVLADGAIFEDAPA